MRLHSQATPGIGNIQDIKKTPGAGCFNYFSGNWGSTEKEGQGQVLYSYIVTI
jgi:hypothetical protein